MISPLEILPLTISEQKSYDDLEARFDAFVKKHFSIAANRSREVEAGEVFDRLLYPRVFSKFKFDCEQIGWILISKLPDNPKDASKFYVSVSNKVLKSMLV